MSRRAEEQECIVRFHQGSTISAYDFMGAHPAQQGGESGYVFRVWAPTAKAVSVVGDFNNWEHGANAMEKISQGVWEGFIPGLQQYDNYKYSILGADGKNRMKSDPYAFHFETRPGNSSKLYDIRGYQWQDGAWQEHCKTHSPYDAPMNIYEVHLGSWQQRPNGDFIDYRDLADQLSAYVKEMGFNYIELLPITEHPLDASWGYQCTGYYAPTSRYGVPHDFMYFVDKMHQTGIGVILDWVPAHFCKDAFGLYEFDGSCCYEYADPKRQEHKDWGTRVFDYARPEVRSFLFSSAAFWLKEYHIDGLRVDAVASMLYLDYSRQAGEWSPNKYGGHEHLEAIDFLRDLNQVCFGVNPHVLMVAEESTAWPMVTKPPQDGGLGFNFKWNMGWMNDMCHYLKLDPWFRQFHHKDITFSMMYAFSENYVLPMSHDEVVHMKGSVFGKMPGDAWLKFAGVRGFYAYMLAHPGKKLSFMGVELGTEEEWAFYKALNWSLLEQPDNAKLHQCIKDLNHFYLNQSALWEIDFDWQGFEWLVSDDNSNNVVVFLRRDKAGKTLACAVNFSPNTYEDYRFGCPPFREFAEVFNTDAEQYGGTGVTNPQPAKVSWKASHGKESSVSIRIPPMGAVFLEGRGKLRAKPKPRTTKKVDTKKAAPAAGSGAEKKEPAQKMEQPAASAVKKTTKKRGTSK